MKTQPSFKLIRTPEDRQAHINRCTQPEEGDTHRELLGDIATTQSHYVHNPATGHHEFAKGTPEWVVAIAQARNWISTVGDLPPRTV